jgi:hypothetical protein
LWGWAGLYRLFVGIKNFGGTRPYSLIIMLIVGLGGFIQVISGKQELLRNPPLQLNYDNKLLCNVMLSLNLILIFLEIGHFFEGCISSVSQL